MGGVQRGGPGGGGMVEQIFSKKLVSKKNRRKGSRGLGAYFPSPYPGVTPPRIRMTGPPSSDFFGKIFLKKISTWRKK